MSEKRVFLRQDIDQLALEAAIAWARANASNAGATPEFFGARVAQVAGAVQAAFDPAPNAPASARELKSGSSAPVEVSQSRSLVDEPASLLARSMMGQSKTSQADGQ